MITSPKTLGEAFCNAEWVPYQDLKNGDEVIAVTYKPDQNQFFIRTFEVDRISEAYTTHKVIGKDEMSYNQNAYTFFRIVPQLPTEEHSVIRDVRAKALDTVFITATLVSGMWRAISPAGVQYNLYPQEIISFDKVVSND